MQSSVTVQPCGSTSCWIGLQVLPPEQRATAVSLTTSGMYMGSAGAIQFLPGLGRRFGAAFLTRFNGGLGLAWLLLWLSVSSRLPSRCACKACRPPMKYPRI